MADKEHLDRLKEGIGSWNRWREENPDVQPDLSNANLAKADLVEANFSKANITGANFAEANLRGANFSNFNPNLNSVSSRSALILSCSLILIRILSGVLAGAAGFSLMKYFAFDLILQGYIVFFALVAVYATFIFLGLTRRSLNVVIFILLISVLSSSIITVEVFIYAFVGIFLIAFDAAIIRTLHKPDFFNRIQVCIVGIYLFYINLIDKTIQVLGSKEYFWLGIPIGIVIIIVNFYIAYKILNEENSGSYLKSIALSFSSFAAIDFRQANLINANFTGSNLLHVNLENTILTGVCFYDVEQLETAKLNGTILADPKIQKLLVSRGQGEEKNYHGKNLKGAYLVEANLSGADLSEVDISGANLSMANLSGANLSSSDLSNANFKGANLSETVLVAIKALGTNFSEATLTGACLEDWNINNATKLNDIDCQYVYLKSNKQERRPSSGEFTPGEFTKLFQKALETVDLIFTDGIDWKAFLLSFQELQAEYGEENLSVQAIEKKSGGAFVIRLEVPPEANKADIESQAKALYEIQLKALEARYHAELQAKDEKIITHRQQNATLENIIYKLADRPIQNINSAIANAEKNSVSETFNNNFNQPNIANFANKNQDDARQQANQNIYQSQQNQNLDGTKEEIQQLLNQLAQTNPTTDVVTEAIHQKIKTDPTFKARLLAALKAGGLEALKAIFNHPAFSIPAETIKGYLEAE